MNYPSTHLKIIHFALTACGDDEGMMRDVEVVMHDKEVKEWGGLMMGVRLR